MLSRGPPRSRFERIVKENQEILSRESRESARLDDDVDDDDHDFLLQRFNNTEIGNKYFIIPLINKYNSNNFLNIKSYIFIS